MIGTPDVSAEMPNPSSRRGNATQCALADAGEICRPEIVLLVVAGLDADLLHFRMGLRLIQIKRIPVYAGSP